MADTNNVSAFIERYQLLYEKDPDSKIFAPLAEAYRRMGMVEEAISLARRGVTRHPNFASGRVALGKCYVQKDELDQAIEHLKVAVELSPENLLAHQLLAECYVKTRRPAEALNAFKMVLFLNPHDLRAAKVVKKLEEDLFAEEAAQEAEEFMMEKIREVTVKTGGGLKVTAEEQKAQADRDMEREMALLDTRFDRGDWEAARAQLDGLLKKHPENPEILRRKRYLDELTQTSLNSVDFLEPLPDTTKAAKVEKLKGLLEKIDARRKA